MVTFVEAVEMLAELSLQIRALEAQQHFLAILKSTMLPNFSTPDLFRASMINVDLTHKLNDMRIALSRGSRLALQKLPSELANYHYTTDLNRLRGSLTYNDLFLPNLLYNSPPVKSIGGGIFSSATRGKSKEIGSGDGLGEPTSLSAGNRSTQESKVLGIDETRRKTMRSAQDFERSTRFLPIKKITDLDSSGTGSLTPQEVLRIPGILQAAVQDVFSGKFGQVNLLARTRSSGKYKEKAMSPAASFLPLQSYIMPAGDTETGKTHGTKQTGKIPVLKLASTRTKLTNKESRAIHVPYISKLPISTIAHRTITGLHAASVGKATLNVPALWEAVLRGIFPGVKLNNLVKGPTNLEIAGDGKINKPVDESPRSSLNLHVMAIEGLTRGFPNVSQADSNTPAIEPDPIKFVSSLLLARRSVALRTGSVMTRAFGTAYATSRRPAAHTVQRHLSRGEADLVRPREVELSTGQSMTNSHSPEAVEGIPRTGLAPSLADATRKDLSSELREDDRLRRKKRDGELTHFDTKRDNAGFTPAASLRQVYSRFTLDRIVRRGKGGAAAAMLVNLQKTPGNLLSVPPRRVESRNRRNMQFDPMNRADGSLDLPQVSQLRAMLAEHVIRRMNSSLTTPMVALAHPIPQSSSRLHRGLTRYTYQQITKVQEDGFSGYRSSPTVRQNSSSSSRQNESGDRRFGSEVRSVTVDTAKKDDNSSMRDLRKKMEQIFQEELKRYGL